MLEARDALRLGLLDEVERIGATENLRYLMALNTLTFLTGKLLEGNENEKRTARTMLGKKIAAGRRVHLRKAFASGKSTSALCGKVVHGFPCDLPAGSSCPDCGKGTHDYQGE